MLVIPFGEVVEDRFELSKKYKLVEIINGIWRLTEKCKGNYDQLSYLRYLQSKVEKPTRISSKKPIQKQPPEKIVKADPDEFKDPECQQIINEILSM